MSMTRRTSRRTLSILIAAVTVITLGASWKSRVDYGTFRFWALPHRIEFCGRQYHRALSTIEWKPRVVADSTWNSARHVVGHTLTRKRILVMESSGRDSSGCAQVLYVETGESRFRPYM